MRSKYAMKGFINLSHTRTHHPYVRTSHGRITFTYNVSKRLEQSHARIGEIVDSLYY